MSYLDGVISGSTRIQHHVLHRTVGEDGPLTLKGHAGDSGLLDLAVVSPGGFTVQRVQPQFDGAADYLTVSQHTITIPANTLPAALAQQAVAADWQGTRYKLELTDSPMSINRRWQFLATPMETL